MLNPCSTAVKRSNATTSMAAPPRKKRHAHSAKLEIVQDGVVNAGWVRANLRSTTLKMTATGLGLDTVARLRDLASSNQNAGGFLEITFALKYADTMEPCQMLQRNQYKDKFELNTPTGAIHESTPTFLDHFGVHTRTGLPLAERNVTNAHMPWTTEMLEVCEDTLEFGLAMRFATNVTSHAHGDRRFFWEAALTWQEAACEDVQTLNARSHVFDYRPRPPPGLNDHPKLEEVHCDGRGGDLLMCMGERIGDEFTDVVCEVVNAWGVDITLQRAKSAKHSYVARLPTNIAPGQYTVQMRIEDGSNRTSNGQHLEIYLPGSPPATPLHEGMPATPAHQPAATTDKAMMDDNEDTAMAWMAELWDQDDLGTDAATASPFAAFGATAQATTAPASPAPTIDLFSLAQKVDWSTVCVDWSTVHTPIEAAGTGCGLAFGRVDSLGSMDGDDITWLTAAMCP